MFGVQADRFWSCCKGIVISSTFYAVPMLLCPFRFDRWVGFHACQICYNSCNRGWTTTTRNDSVTVAAWIFITFFTPALVPLVKVLIAADCFRNRITCCGVADNAAHFQKPTTRLSGLIGSSWLFRIYLRNLRLWQRRLL